MSQSNDDLASLLSQLRANGRVAGNQWPEHVTSPGTLGLLVEDQHVALPTDVHLHDRQYLQEQLSLLHPNVTVSLYDVVDSTNVAMGRIARDTRIANQLFVAEYQSAGRGRRGKSWVGDYGRNVAMTIGVNFNRPINALGGLSCVVGLALIQALEQFGVAAQLKWPNDVWVDDQKLAGVLVELVQAHDCVDAIVGIGMNVNLSNERVSQIDQKVTSLRSLGFEMSRDDLVVAVYTSVARNLEAFREHGFSRFVAAFNAVHRLHDHLAVLRIGESERSGIVRGVEPGGGLIFEESSGTSIITAGEVSIRPSFSSN